MRGAAMERYYVGLDLGQRKDFSAVTAVRRVELTGAEAEPDAPRRKVRHSYEVVALHRYPLGTAYPDIVADVVPRLARDPLCARAAEPPAYFSDWRVARPAVPARKAATVLIDGTGVGKPVVDLFRAAGIPAIDVTITGGLKSSQPERHEWHVPKREIVSVLQVLLQSERLKVPDTLPMARLLLQELRTFQVRITAAGADTYGTWREREHDDLVLAVGIACWAGERIPAPRKLVFY
jgi:hypothetical protein